MLLYLFDEQDLLDDRELGALGLLDDAYLVHGCVAMTLYAGGGDAGAGEAAPRPPLRVGEALAGLQR